MPAPVLVVHDEQDIRELAHADAAVAAERGR
jgi:hypothetical protein